MTDPDKPELPPPIRVVLVGTSHAGNIGASARAMKTMGLGALVLVSPSDFPSAEATSRAAGADDLLAAAPIHAGLSEAVAGCGFVLGTSARRRHVRWPELSPRDAARRLLAESRHAPVALVFGRERSGLRNDELDLCQALVRIPTACDYSSLNLASAVQVLAYELLVAMREGVPAPEDPHQGVGQDEMEGFYAHLDQVLIEVGYLDPAAPRLLRRRLRRLFNRTRPDRPELNILRGILSAITRFRDAGPG